MFRNFIRFICNVKNENSYTIDDVIAIVSAIDPNSTSSIHHHDQSLIINQRA